MKEKTKGVSLFVWILYGVMLLLTFILIMISREKHKIENPVDQQHKGTISLIDNWVDENGKVIDLSNLYYTVEMEAGKEYWLYHSISSDIKEGYTLNITAKNVYYELYVDGKPLLDVYNANKKELENYFGRRYSMIPIEKSMAGKKLEMRLVFLYHDISSTFIEITLGLPQGHLLYFAREKLVSLVTSMLFLFVSLLLILIDIPINMKNDKNHELLALGLFSFAVGMWGLMSTHVLEYFTGDGRTTQIAACLFLTLIVLPLLIYIRDSIGFFSYRELNIYAILYFTEFFVVWILELTNTLAVQCTLKFTHIMLAFGVLLLVSMIFRKNKHGVIRKESMIYHLFRMIGLIAIIVGTIIDFFRYYQGNVADNAIYVRFGLLIFIMCYGVASLEKTITAVKIGAKAEFISLLAYKDGLTNLSNRTAFQERLETLQMKQQNVAIIMFDVNDLKKVNDNLGHQYGDEMLVTSAQIISDSFGTNGVECYRIGGDEFVVILFKDNIWDAVTNGLQTFEEAINEYNEHDHLKYQIHIAYGYAIIDDEKCSINELYEIADQRMYKCKKQMKVVIEQSASSSHPPDLS